MSKYVITREQLYKDEFFEIVKESVVFDKVIYEDLPDYKLSMDSYHVISKGSRQIISPDQLEVLAAIYNQEHKEV